MSGEAFGRAHGIAVDATTHRARHPGGDRGAIPDQLPGRGLGLQHLAKMLIFPA